MHIDAVFIACWLIAGVESSIAKSPPLDNTSQNAPKRPRIVWKKVLGNVTARALICSKYMIAGDLQHKQKRTPDSFRNLGFITLAMSYSRTTYRSTTIGAAAFHFRVRNGNGWDHCARITRRLAKSKLARGGMGAVSPSTSPEILTIKVIGNVVRGCGSTWISRS